MIKKSKFGLILILALFVSFLVLGFASAFTTGLEDSPLFITTKGTVPETIDQESPNEITDCWMYLNNRESYSEFDISIISFDLKDNYILVELDPDYQEEINEIRINEMYQKINDACDPFYGYSEIPVVFMWYNPINGFENAEKMSGFIEARGTIPDITRIEEKKEWYAQLYASAPASKVRNYTNEKGIALTSFGHHMDGYLNVGFVREVDEATIDEMYEIIETHYEQAGISDVPVVFFVEGEIIEDIENNEDTNNQTPGFTSILLILSLLLAVKVKRK